MLLNAVSRRTYKSHVRCFFRRNVSFLESKSEEKKWKNMVKEAERVVGYPTSFLSLRWILNDEIANVGSHIRRLIGTNHPLLQTAKNLLLKNELPTWGLIVLLVSKMAGYNSNFPELECDKNADILHSQRSLAEVTEMIKTSHLLHKGLINVDPSDENAADLNYGNKLALLCGDYLLSSSFHQIACLRNSQVQESISSAIRDLTESEFIGLRNAQNEAIPSKPNPVQKYITIPDELGVQPFKFENVMGNMKAEWTLRNILGGGSLLGKSCQCSLILANHPLDVQEQAYKFGRNLALAWQAALEIKLLQNAKFSLVSAPVMLHLEEDSDFYEQLEGAFYNDDVNYNHFRKVVMDGYGVQKTQMLQKELTQNALNALEIFANNKSKDVLISIANSV